MFQYKQMIEHLMTIQKELRETDTEFATRLGIKRTVWIALRQGRCKPGPKSWPGILRAFPKMVKYLTDVDK